MLSQSIRKLAMLAGMAGLATLILPAPARADVILTFGQSTGGNPITGTENAAHTQTTITGANVATTITSIAGIAIPPSPTFLNFNAASTSPATTVVIGGSTVVSQSFTGTFSFWSGLGMTGTNYLSGSFVDALVGAGSGFTLTASTGGLGESVTFTSGPGGIPTNLLGAPQAVSFGFTNVLPAPLGVTGSSLSSFTAGVSGQMSAFATPEPGTIAMALSALPAFGLYLARRRRRRVRA